MRGIKRRFLILIIITGFTIHTFNTSGFTGYLFYGDELADEVITEQGAEGSAEVALYGNNTAVIENTITEDAQIQPVVEVPKVYGIQASFFFSEHIKIFYLPLTYSFTDFLTLNMSIPFIMRSMKYNNKTYSAKGIGDMTFGFSFLQNIAEGFTGITRFKVSVPTGDENARDEGFRVPLGSGGYSLSLLQSFSKMLDPLRLFGSLGFIFFLQSEYTYGPILYTVEKSPIYNLMLGTEYWFLQSFSLLLKANLIMVSEGRIKATGTRWVDLNDSLTTSDIIPGIKYHIIRNVLFTYLMFVLPVYTKHDSDLSNKPDRKWGLDFGVTGLF